MKTLSDLLALADSSPLWAIDGLIHDGTKPKSPTDEAAGESIATVFERKQLDTLQLDVLGELETGSVKVFSSFHRKTFEIRSIDHLSYETLLQIAGPPVKQHVNRSSSDRHMEDRFPLAEVKDAISLLAGYKQISDQTELGVGCWQGQTEDGDEYPSVVVVGDTEAAEWNGVTLDRIAHPRCRGHILDFGSANGPWYRHSEIEGYLLAAREEKFCNETIDSAFNLFERWRWKNPIAGPIVITGMVMATWVQTIWDWRPQVAIIGASNAGKTTLFKCLSKMFGRLCLTSSGSSAAGIRQKTKTTARIVLCDEFEKNKERDQILEMLRASGRGDPMFKGTTNQRGMGFLLRHIFWVAAIESGLRNEPDRNRFVTQELVRPTTEEKKKFKLPTTDELRDLGQRLLACAVVNIHAAKAMAAALKEQTGRYPGVNDRVIESYAVPAAMLAVLQGFGLTDAEVVLEAMVKESAEDSTDIADEAELLRDILGAPIHTGRTMLTASQLINVLESPESRSTDKENAVDMLGKSGLAILCEQDGDGRKCLAIAYKAVSEYLLRNTVWASKSIDQVLRRLPFITDTHARRRVGGQRHYCVLIDYEYVKTEFLGDAETGVMTHDEFLN